MLAVVKRMDYILSILSFLSFTKQGLGTKFDFFKIKYFYTKYFLYLCLKHQQKQKKCSISFERFKCVWRVEWLKLA